MENQTVYGAILIAYLVPYFIWTISRDQKIEMLKQFYPGRADDGALERRGYVVGGGWVAGLVILLVGWKLNWPPIAALILVAIAWLIVVVAGKAQKFRELLKLRRTRSVVASIVIWFALVLGWYIVFGDRYGFEPSDAILVALVPLPIAMLAWSAYLWVRKGQS